MEFAASEPNLTVENGEIHGRRTTTCCNCFANRHRKSGANWRFDLSISYSRPETPPWIPRGKESTSNPFSPGGESWRKTEREDFHSPSCPYNIVLPRGNKSAIGSMSIEAIDQGQDYRGEGEGGSPVAGTGRGEGDSRGPSVIGKIYVGAVSN
ncbi:coproporphyrinogen III oxidase [Anopheles sinensis]|uniref:Coproporphyrinogen III oxidase n=1 Tax=Anopheles sinensis TaxID=74873 RepID=A0A084W745_ANOSI|nr:coproporphyrinogen III oxidase [Anopheles sinensis]